jgi:uncharacterized membrane protein YeaQ/YmgE (transglycosylase-associated protein family)
MSLLSWIILFIIAAIAGSIGQALAGYSLGGCLASAVVGFIGAYIGMWLAKQFGLPEPFPVHVGTETFPLMWSIIGSMVLSLLLGLISRRRLL